MLVKRGKSWLLCYSIYPCDFFVPYQKIVYCHVYDYTFHIVLFSLIFRVKVRDYDCSEVQAWKLFQELRTCS